MINVIDNLFNMYKNSTILAFQNIVKIYKAGQFGHWLNLI